VSAASALPEVDAAPPPRVREYRASLADLRGDALGECVDFSIDVTLGLDAGEPKKDPIEAILKGQKGLTKIGKPCAESFPDRTAYATCTLTKREDDGGTSVSIVVVSHRFDFAAVADTDRNMKECLEMRGEWNAIRRDSPEWHAAKTEQARKRLERLTR
jgi:hypothetical protein